jgi:hypothetical protein
MITFHNQPKFSPHEADRESNDRRRELVPIITNFLSGHERFKNQTLEITFAEKGVSSLVVFVATPVEKLVLKIPLSHTLAKGENEFLKIWQKAGVRVPNILEEGSIDDSDYTLMEFIDAPILGEAYSPEDLSANGLYFEMGQTLRRMHEPKAVGYGAFIDGKGKYPTFVDWLGGQEFKDMIGYVGENNLIDDSCGSVEVAARILQTAADQSASSYCHFDFGSYNIFATRPITVFDPNPQCHFYYLDLGQTVAVHTALGFDPEQIVAGYFAGDSCDERLLQAAILLSACRKFVYWHKTGKSKIIARLQNHLRQNRNLLL